jgi:DNA-binding MarR family transcriptional regulator
LTVANDYRPHYWKRGVRTPGLLIDGARAGDSIAPHGHASEWVKVRRGLKERGLIVLSVGSRFVVAPEVALGQLPQLRALASAAHNDRAALVALRDFVQEFFGEHCSPSCGLAEALARAASEGTHAVVPGNLEAAAAWQKQREEECQRFDRQHEEEKRKREAKLSALQKRILRFVWEYGPHSPYWWDGHEGSVWAPVAVTKMPQPIRSSPPALSRALRRLEERGLVVLRKSTHGRTEEIGLTHDGLEYARGC